MITYSRNDMLRQLVADQAFWRRVPAKLAAVLWPLEIVALGWSPGWWVGLATVIVLSAGSVLLPPRLRVSIYLVDLLEWLTRLPVDLVWLVMAWHLTVREPALPVFGLPVIGALLATALTRFLAGLTTFSVRLAARHWTRDQSAA